MNTHHTPDPMERLALLGDINNFEPAGDITPNEKATANHMMINGQRNIPLNIKGVLSCITEVSTPMGTKPMLKAMVTTACEMNCYYCPFRAGRSAMKRVTFKPDELAAAFDQLVKGKLVEGIFLSSGIIKGGASTQDKIIDTAEIIRRKYHYGGYIHLKIMPGSQYAQVVRSMQLANRVSINLEGPTTERLGKLAPKKDFAGDLLERLLWTSAIRESEDPASPEYIRSSTVTQLVVGAVGDTDLEHLSLTEQLYRQVKLKRAYFSAFNPIEETPFENLTATPTMREFRLYQSSFLLRDYDWEVEDLPFQQDGNLRLEVDPKKAYADEHLIDNPVDVMTAQRRELMRIPGVGPKGAESIIKQRQKGHITDLTHLRQIGIRGVEQSAPYILLDGKKPSHQLSLFD